MSQPELKKMVRGLTTLPTPKPTQKPQPKPPPTQEEELSRETLKSKSQEIHEMLNGKIIEYSSQNQNHTTDGHEEINKKFLKFLRDKIDENLQLGWGKLKNENLTESELLSIKNELNFIKNEVNEEEGKQEKKHKEEEEKEEKRKKKQKEEKKIIQEEKNDIVSRLKGKIISETNIDKQVIFEKLASSLISGEIDIETAKEYEGKIETGELKGIENEKEEKEKDVMVERLLNQRVSETNAYKKSNFKKLASSLDRGEISIKTAEKYEKKIKNGEIKGILELPPGPPPGPPIPGPSPGTPSPPIQGPSPQPPPGPSPPSPPETPPRDAYIKARRNQLEKKKKFEEAYKNYNENNPDSQENYRRLHYELQDANKKFESADNKFIDDDEKKKINKNLKKKKPPPSTPETPSPPPETPPSPPPGTPPPLPPGPPPGSKQTQGKRSAYLYTKIKYTNFGVILFCLSFIIFTYLITADLSEETYSDFFHNTSLITLLFITSLLFVIVVKRFYHLIFEPKYGILLLSVIFTIPMILGIVLIGGARKQFLENVENSVSEQAIQDVTDKKPLTVIFPSYISSYSMVFGLLISILIFIYYYLRPKEEEEKDIGSSPYHTETISETRPSSVYGFADRIKTLIDKYSNNLAPLLDEECYIYNDNNVFIGIKDDIDITEKIKKKLNIVKELKNLECLANNELKELENKKGCEDVSDDYYNISSYYDDILI